MLILSTSVSGGASSPEAPAATALGLTVEIATPASGRRKTTADFAGYKAVILGDPTCGTSAPSSIGAAEANTSVWGPAITGNVIVIGTDEAFHHSRAGAN